MTEICSNYCGLSYNIHISALVSHVYTMFRKFTNLVRNPQTFCEFRSKDLSEMQFSIRKFLIHSAVELSNRDKTLFGSSDDAWKAKIIYNEVLLHEKNTERIRTRNERMEYKLELYNYHKQSNVKSLFLQCMTDDNHDDVKASNELIHDSKTPSIVHFPYDIQKNVNIDRSISHETTESDSDNNVVSDHTPHDTQLKNIHKHDIQLENPRTWQKNDNQELCDDIQFGSYDPNIPVSNVPCGGCGALLHCKDTAIPGFVPKEIFEDLTETDLIGITCQRCLFLQEYDIALSVSVNPDDYPEILKKIKTKKVLVILMVDLLDFPCSIWPGIMNVIGEDKPVVVVGNKVDLIIQDKEKNFIKHRKKCLINTLEDIGLSSANIKHVALISAKTGYGVENLINQLHDIWGSEGDIYIVGCTNVGKSTFFNTLIQSDFCKSKATDVLQRATVSQWPGTTLNLLKFPILKPLAWRKAIRSQRLKLTNKQIKALKELQTRVLRNRGVERQTSLKGYLGKSFWNKETSTGTIGLDPNEPEFKNSKWCYDTPGVVHRSQILNLFTTEELSKVLPRKTVVPRNFKLISGNALFIGGIARLDLISCEKFVWFTVYASSDLPVTVTSVEHAELIYEKLLGTKMFAVPEGGEERLKKWPKLKPKDITVNGSFKDIAAADVVLSSAGWVAITLELTFSCNLRAWTPDQRGIYVRDTPLIRQSSHYRGKKIPGTPAYHPSIEIIENIKFVT